MKFRSFYRIFFYPHGSLPRGTWRIAGVALAALLLSICQSANAQAGFERIDQIRQKIDQFLTAEYKANKAEKVEVQVGALDSRLRLPSCEQSLVLNLQDTTGNGGNVNVQVICNGPSRWTILVPAVARVFRPVAIAGRNFQRGEQIAAGDLVSELRDMSQYRQGFSLAADDLIGKELKYPVAKGEAFRTSALTSALVIKRGDEVTLQASSGGITVVTSGTAVSDGRIGQQIRVKNTKSERLVNARVVGPGKVQTLM